MAMDEEEDVIYDCAAPVEEAYGVQEYSDYRRQGLDPEAAAIATVNNYPGGLLNLPGMRETIAAAVMNTLAQLNGFSPEEEALEQTYNEPPDRVRHRKPPYSSNPRMWESGARIELIDPVQAALLKLNLSDKRELTLKEADITAVEPKWEEWGILPSREGAKLATGRKGRWNYIVNPQTNQVMTPGFNRIDAIGNEGMVGFLAATNGYYLVTAKDFPQAVKRHLELPKEAEALVAYPFFLQASELLVTRFNPEDVQSGADPVLNQLLGRDPFRLQKRTLHPMDLEVRQNFDRLSKSIHGYTAQYGAVVNMTVPNQQGFNLPPVDTDELSAQMLMTFHDSGTRVISLHDISENDVLDPGGFHLVQEAGGGLFLIDSRLEKVLSDPTSPEYQSMFIQSSNLVHLYLDALKAARTREIVTRAPNRWQRARQAAAMAAFHMYALMYPPVQDGP